MKEEQLNKLKDRIRFHTQETSPEFLERLESYGIGSPYLLQHLYRRLVTGSRIDVNQGGVWIDGVRFYDITGKKLDWGGSNDPVYVFDNIMSGSEDGVRTLLQSIRKRVGKLIEEETDELAERELVTILFLAESALVAEANYRYERSIAEMNKLHEELDHRLHRIRTVMG